MSTKEEVNGPMTTQEVLDLPASMDLETACRALGIHVSKGYRLVNANAFPCPVVKLGRTYRIPKPGLLRVLGLDPAAGPGTNG